MKTYLFSYWHEGQRFGASLRAGSLEEAERHIRSIRCSATLDGELLPVFGWFRSLFGAR